MLISDGNFDSTARIDFSARFVAVVVTGVSYSFSAYLFSLKIIIQKITP